MLCILHSRWTGPVGVEPALGPGLPKGQHGPGQTPGSWSTECGEMQLEPL